MLSSEIILPSKNHHFSVIWLHGLGADGFDFLPIVNELTFDNKSYCKFIFPHAPFREVTINGQMKMRAWYDIKSMELNRQPDIENILNSQNDILELVKLEITNGIASDKIILAGFSQGGLIALSVALFSPIKVNSVISLSSYLPDSIFNQPANNIPVFLAHGIHDPVIPLEIHENTHDYLKKLGLRVFKKNYSIQHQVSWDEILDLNHFFNQQTELL